MLAWSLGIALNLVLGTIIHTLKLPVALDAVGTVLVTLLGVSRAVGVVSFLIGGILINPFYLVLWDPGGDRNLRALVGRRGDSPNSTPE